MTRAFIFPGQGSQFIGMGKDLAENFSIAKDIFDKVDDSLNQKLSALMFDGDIADLNLTENTQPALMAVSVAVARILETECGVDFADGTTKFAAGHSLGEYSALTAMRALSVADTARLLRIRGTAMQKAVPVGVGAMAAILGLDFDDVAAIAAQASGDESCTAANDNSDGQVVISGHKAAVERAMALATEKGAKRAILLPVSAPFHCPLMQPAADAMAEALADVTINAPLVPIVANVTANTMTDADAIRDALVAQVCGMVRWRESVLFMAEQGVTEMIELGAAKVLTGLTRRIDRSISGRAIGTAEAVKEFNA